MDRRQLQQHHHELRRLGPVRDPQHALGEDPGQGQAARRRLFSLVGLADADDDFVAAVSFDPNGGYDVFVMPSVVVECTLRDENARWIAGTKPSGGPRKPTSMRHLYIDDREDGAPAHGFAKRWAQYRNAWGLLERYEA